jgi:lipoprotein-releasing system permease protein
MRFERFMAYRYLLGAQGRSEGRRFLRFIMYAAVGGVAVGVAALLLSLSVVRGFSREIQEKIIGFGAHIQVESYQDAPLRNADGIRTQLARFEHVGVVSPVVQEFVLLRKATDQIEGVVLWGTEAMPPYLVGHLVAGTASFDPDERGRTGLVIGRTLSEVLGVSPGDVLTAFSLRKPPEDEGAAPVFGFSRPRVQQFYVSGIYETSLHNYDELYVFTEIEAARGLLQYAPDEVTRLDVSLTQVGHVERVRGAIEAEFGFPVMARTIYEVYRGLFAWVNLQENIIPLVISVIVLVAAFNIVGTLLMIILEKTREIGVLESMGASARSMRRLFLWLGLFIGVTGTLIGQALALALALIQQRYGVIPLPAEAYYMTTAPVALNPADFLLVGAVALLLCVLAAYVPARVASRVDPIRVIRFR